MKLSHAKIGPYKSIAEPQTLTLEADITVLVGQNESGKSALLEALNKSRPISNDIKFDAVYDYPRNQENRYRREHPQFDTVVTDLTYRLSPEERRAVHSKLGVELAEDFEFTIQRYYNNAENFTFPIDETKALQHYIDNADIPHDIKESLKSAITYKAAAETLEASKPADENAKAFLGQLRSKIQAADNHNSAAFEAYKEIKGNLPTFLYFSDYNILPGKTNLTELKRRKTENQLELRDRTVLALLNTAGVNLDELLTNKPYEESVAKLQGFSIEVSDNVFKFWKQNEQLEVQFDVRNDPTDQPPFNSGPNLYVRVRNNRHRVDLPFDQRSRGFIWFFSFIAWFDDAKTQAGATTPVFLLLDEPGLSLHALAQKDFLDYIEHLGESHQVVYTTHSPFLVDSGKLERVRVIEDVQNSGTTISDQLDSKDRRSIFPLQAALGYTIAQNLFISQKNVLIEGPADLLYLQDVSEHLQANAREGLNPSVTLVPVGGMDKVATFIALLFGNQLDCVVCVDKPTVPDQRLKDMVAKKLLNADRLLDFGMFRRHGDKGDATDVEDMFTIRHYLAMFNSTYQDKLQGNVITENDLPAGSRIVQRIEDALASKGLALRPSGGFNHYIVAKHVITSGLQLEAEELDAFEELFHRLNDLFVKMPKTEAT